MKYAGNVTVEWGRLAGDADDDDQLADDPPPADATAGANVVVDDTCSTIAWNVTIDGTPIEISVKACAATKLRSVQASAAVAKLMQTALRARAAGAQGPVRAVLSALVPPQARAAVQAAHVVVGLVRSGRLGSLLHRLRGGARVIGRALAESSR